MYEELEILERTLAMHVLKAVMDNPGLSKQDISRMGSSQEHTKFVRINDLIDAGLIECEKIESGRNKTRLYLTKEGQTVAAHLGPIIEALASAKNKKISE